MGRYEELIERIVQNQYDIEALKEICRFYSDTTSEYFNVQLWEEVVHRILRISPNDEFAKEQLNSISRKKGIYIPGEDFINYQYSARVVVGRGTDSYDVIRYIRPNWIVLIIFLIYIIFILGAIGFWGFNAVQPLFYRNHDRLISRMTSEASDANNLKVNKLTDMDGMYKNAVLDLRKQHVRFSMFDSADYKPSQEVFGGIQDNKPWFGTENFICHDTSNPDTIKEGYSYVSRLINNPAMLIGINPAGTWDFANWKYRKDEYKLCSDPRALFIPRTITYSPNLNLITATFDIDKNILDAGFEYSFIGLNARDLGYNWGYVYNFNNIHFINDYNISKNLYQFTDYIAVGNSCRIKGGCNNVCPVQDSLFFKLGNENNNFEGYQAYIDFKLWKEKPRSIYANPDMYYRIILDKQSNWLFKSDRIRL